MPRGAGRLWHRPKTRKAEVLVSIGFYSSRIAITGFGWYHVEMLLQMMSFQVTVDSLKTAFEQSVAAEKVRISKLTQPAAARFAVGITCVFQVESKKMIALSCIVKLSSMACPRATLSGYRKQFEPTMKHGPSSLPSRKRWKNSPSCARSQWVSADVNDLNSQQPAIGLREI